GTVPNDAALDDTDAAGPADVTGSTLVEDSTQQSSGDTADPANTSLPLQNISASDSNGYSTETGSIPTIFATAAVAEGVLRHTTYNNTFNVKRGSVNVFQTVYADQRFEDGDSMFSNNRIRSAGTDDDGRGHSDDGPYNHSDGSISAVPWGVIASMVRTLGQSLASTGSKRKADALLAAASVLEEEANERAEEGRASHQKRGRADILPDQVTVRRSAVEDDDENDDEHEREYEYTYDNREEDEEDEEEEKDEGMKRRVVDQPE
ncbi:hypothetical protein BGZ83_001414, partial [Gryganskiella cystojenkinii]